MLIPKQTRDAKDKSRHDPNIRASRAQKILKRAPQFLQFLELVFVDLASMADIVFHDPGFYGYAVENSKTLVYKIGVI